MQLRLLAIGFLCAVAAGPGRAGQYGPVVEGQVPHTLANPVTLNGGVTSAPTFSMVGAVANINYTPFANNIPLYTPVVVASTVRQTAVREFGFSIDQKALVGDSSITSGQDGALPFFVDQECGGTAQRCWLANFVSILDANANPKNYHGVEINLNTAATLDMSGSVADPSSLTQTSWAIPITGVALNSTTKGKFTGGVVLGGDGSNPFGQGYTVLPATVKNVSFADWGNAAISHLAVGAHTYGFSAVGLIGTAPTMTGGPNFEAASGNGYFGRNKANTADFELIGTDANNNVVIGAGGVNSITPQTGMNFPNNTSVGFANAAGSATIVGVGTDSSNRVVVGTNAASVVLGTNATPAADGGSALGSSTLRYNGTWSNLFYASPGYAFASLPTGQPAGAHTYCTNCVNPDGTTGALVTSASSGWYGPNGQPAATTNPAFTAYSPTISCSSGSLTSASASGRYQKLGRSVTVQISVSITTNGNCAGFIKATLPATSAAFPYNIGGREDAATGNAVLGNIPASSTVVNILNTSNGYPGANGYQLDINGVYESAS